MKLIFDKSGNLLVTTSGVIPSSHEGVDYIVAELAATEEFDFNYNYVINIDGFAVKGELKQIDYEELARITAEIAATAYQRDRAKVYPSIVDQLDTLYHGGYDAWKSEIAIIKQQYPKPQ